MSGGVAARLQGLLGPRPAGFSLPLRLVLAALRPAPPPWGEDAVALLFAVSWMARGRRRRPALAWAAQQPGRRGFWLAARLCGFLGRWVARAALLGYAGPEDLRRDVDVRGAERLKALDGGAILLGFHLGPPHVDLVLRLLGHPVAWLGTRRRSPVWSTPAWCALADPEQNLTPPDGRWFWTGCLYRARRRLLDGGAVFVLADAPAGRELLTIALPGGEVAVRSGWHWLREQTGVPVLPVLTHMQGRTQVITIHPPLPLDPPGAGASDWKGTLAALVRDYARRFPEQCPDVAFSAVPGGRPAAP